MKKLIASIIVLLIATTISCAQTEIASTNTVDKTEVKKETKASVSLKTKAKVLRINRKKNNEIISIKSYRKSLNIKVKTVKMC
ncbi:hypothetical protein [Winogradskyella sp. PG-2]|uniref:hypothetical protein n=1 Tax=Winogradskyella sp. PG-2 TaxID=754409 RepID=UPI0004587095|nr:hypothetical protein [Winogradskyella sp. PG-2]BAO76892.1 hypothetical protein WPG_2662 [Winogradskyella sp. PG-2]